MSRNEAVVALLIPVALIALTPFIATGWWAALWVALNGANVAVAGCNLRRAWNWM